MVRRIRTTPRPSPRGVTLIELMITVAIIGILAVALLAAYRGTRAQAVDGRLVDTLDQFRRFLGLYNASNGAFPTGTNMVNNTDNTGAAAYTALATALQSIEDALPTLASDATINIDTSGTSFRYRPMAGPPPSFLLVAKAINGTGSYFCVGVGQVKNIGTSLPAAGATVCP